VQRRCRRDQNGGRSQGRDDITPAIATVAKGPARALVACEDPLITSNASQIAGFALHNGLPMIGFRPQAEAGALIEYGVELADLFPAPRLSWTRF
jgi:hypothetical protein